MAKRAGTRAFREIRSVVWDRDALATARLFLTSVENEIGVSDVHVTVSYKSAHKIVGLLSTQIDLTCLLKPK